MAMNKFTYWSPEKRCEYIWAHWSSPEPSVKKQLEAIRYEQEQLAQLEGVLVRTLRDNGSSWADIGEALGRSKQAAWERFADTYRKGPDSLPRE
jgi:hypothetical protein